MSPVIVQAALAFGYAIGAEAGLSFLGLGVNPPTSSWGVMLQEAYAPILETQWPLVPPAVAILLAILAFNLVGDGLRDSLGRERDRRWTTTVSGRGDDGDAAARGRRPDRRVRRDRRRAAVSSTA